MKYAGNNHTKGVTTEEKKGLLVDSLSYLKSDVMCLVDNAQGSIEDDFNEASSSIEGSIKRFANGLKAELINPLESAQGSIENELDNLSSSIEDSIKRFANDLKSKPINSTSPDLRDITFMIEPISKWASSRSGDLQFRINWEYTPETQECYVIFLLHPKYHTRDREADIFTVTSNTTIGEIQEAVLTMLSDEAS